MLHDKPDQEWASKASGKAHVVQDRSEPMKRARMGGEHRLDELAGAVVDGEGGGGTKEPQHFGNL